MKSPQSRDSSSAYPPWRRSRKEIVRAGTVTRQAGGADLLQLPALRLGQAAAPAVIDRLPVGAVGGGGGQPLGPGAEAGVEQALAGQGLKGGGVGPGAPGLVHRRPVPVQPQPFQVPEDLVAVFRPAPVRVQVLQPEHHPAPGAPGGQPGQQAGPQVAQVHPAAGAGGEAAHNV